MSRRSSGRSLVGLILEIGFIALVVSILPKFNFQPQQAADSASHLKGPAAPASQSENPWWQAEPSARATSWRGEGAQAVNVEQTLQNASRNLIGSAAEYAGRTAQDLFAPPNSQRPSEPDQLEWRGY